MSSEQTEKAMLLALLGRKLAGEQAVKTVLVQQAIADRLGLNTTDLSCLALLGVATPLTAGQLAEATGLTTGSVTVMIDRLEKAGYVERAKDPFDRRRVIVRPVTEQIDRELAPLYSSLQEGWEEILGRYSTEELAVILDLLTRSAVLLQEQTTALRLGAGEGPNRGISARAAESDIVVALPEQARLILATGAHKLTVRGASIAELFAAQFASPAPEIQVQNSTVRVNYPRFSFFQKQRGTGTITLNPRSRWHIEVRGGANDCGFELEALNLTSFALLDGAFQVTLNVGAPQGVVQIHLSGGAADVTIRRPAGTPTRLLVKGGAVNLRLDERFAHLVSEDWETANYREAADRYEVTVAGGASNLSVIS
ncbi:MAG: MarR family transcriptional regulator [Blastochloris sp.]|nr:MarR family transcriptional regulator [Blastochloris sp.]